MRNSYKIEGKNKKRAVEIEETEYGDYLSVTRNGYQWTSINVDDEILEMIIEVINRRNRNAKSI